MVKKEDPKKESANSEKEGTTIDNLDNNLELELEQDNLGNNETMENELKEPLTQEALEDARKKAAENWDLFLRSRADADNISRRAQEDIKNARKYGIEQLAKELLAVVDSIEYGLSAAADNATIESIREGMVLTQKLLLSILEKFGVKILDPLGEPFNPLYHEALSAQVNNDIEPNKVVVVVQKGFTLHERVLRPARVIVSKKEETTV